MCKCDASSKSEDEVTISVLRSLVLRFFKLREDFVAKGNVETKIGFDVGGNNRSYSPEITGLAVEYVRAYRLKEEVALDGGMSPWEKAEDRILRIESRISEARALIEVLKSESGAGELLKRYKSSVEFRGQKYNYRQMCQYPLEVSELSRKAEQAKIQRSLIEREKPEIVELYREITWLEEFYRQKRTDAVDVYNRLRPSSVIPSELTSNCDGTRIKPSKRRKLATFASAGVVTITGGVAIHQIITDLDQVRANESVIDWDVLNQEVEGLSSEMEQQSEEKEFELSEDGKELRFTYPNGNMLVRVIDLDLAMIGDRFAIMPLGKRLSNLEVSGDITIDYRSVVDYFRNEGSYKQSHTVEFVATQGGKPMVFGLRRLSGNVKNPTFGDIIIIVDLEHLVANFGLNTSSQLEKAFLRTLARSQYSGVSGISTGQKELSIEEIDRRTSLPGTDKFNSHEDIDFIGPIEVKGRILRTILARNASLD